MKEDFDIIQQLLDSCVAGGAFKKAVDVARVQEAIENLKIEIHGLQEPDSSCPGIAEQQPG